jgi:hypothetical protein
MPFSVIGSTEDVQTLDCCVRSVNTCVYYNISLLIAKWSKDISQRHLDFLASNFARYTLLGRIDQPFNSYAHYGAFNTLNPYV